MDDEPSQDISLLGLCLLIAMWIGAFGLLFVWPILATK